MLLLMIVQQSMVYKAPEKVKQYISTSCHTPTTICPSVA